MASGKTQPYKMGTRTLSVGHKVAVILLTISFIKFGLFKKLSAGAPDVVRPGPGHKLAKTLQHLSIV